jgi:hypothetical protein
MDYVVCFLAGGAVVSVFAILGDVLRPKSFAGLLQGERSRNTNDRRRDAICLLAKATIEARPANPVATRRPQRKHSAGASRASRATRQRHLSGSPMAR